MPRDFSTEAYAEDEMRGNASSFRSNAFPDIAMAFAGASEFLSEDVVAGELADPT